ncbi:uncharacterized protein LOC134265362 [Saccostrea cucullata]|uniref:uncharacterized protein LOC134265362 n=1 Tax=Saccostrea cuccullata TaxID=36930 RepID=UPI002ED4132A
MIPGLTVHAIDQARKHSSQFGPGTNITKGEPFKRQKLSKEKLDHALDFFFDPTFHQVTAFGTKNMTMSTGLSITIPNVVRTAYHSTLVDTYLSYCEETDFEPLSKSSLYKILSECPASKRTNLKGLDNIATDGNSAFETLLGIIGEIEKSNLYQSNELKECKEKLQSSKLYIKSEYKLHIQKENSCADHLFYALSDGTNLNLCQSCTHEHDVLCQRCNDLDEAVTSLRSLVSENNGKYSPYFIHICNTVSEVSFA